MRSYRLAHQADADLDELTGYLGERDPVWAVRILEGLHEAFRFLADHPCAGEQREDLRPGLRVFPGRGAARQFLVFYYPLKDGIEVNTVIRGSRDYLGMFERGER